MASNSSGSGGIGLFTVLFIVFLILKLTGYITWSWWWVTSPLWIGWTISFILLIVFSWLAVKYPWWFYRR